MEKTKTKNNTGTVSVGRIVMNIIRKSQDGKGISLPQLKKVLRESKKLDIVLYDSEIKLALKNAMGRGVLSREDGFYKVVEVTNRQKVHIRKGKEETSTNSEKIPKTISRQNKRPRKEDDKEAISANLSDKIAEAKPHEKGLTRKRKGKEETSTNSEKIPKTISRQNKRPRKEDDKEATSVNLPDKIAEAKPYKKGLTRKRKGKEETNTNSEKIPKTISRQSKRSRKEDEKEATSVNPPDKIAEAEPRQRARKKEDKGLTRAKSESPNKISNIPEKDRTTEDVMEPTPSNAMNNDKIPNPKLLVEMSQEKTSDQQ